MARCDIGTDIVLFCFGCGQFKVGPALSGLEEHMREALQMFLGKEVEKQVEMGFAKDGRGGWP